MGTITTVALAKPQLLSTEAALIDRYCQGDAEAFYELVRPYERTVFRAAYAGLNNEADAEDAAQEAMLKAFAGLRRFRRESKFSTWLIQITINEARLKLRKERRARYESLNESREGEEGEYFPRDFADWREISSEALAQQQLREALVRALAGLSARNRAVFVLRDVEQLSVAETARALGISEAAVKTRLLRARLQMRDALAPGIDGSWASGLREYRQVRPF